MHKRVLGALLVVVVVAGIGSGQRTVQTRAGDVAEGERVREENGIFVLNTTPCNQPNQSQYLQFHQPYRTRSLGQGSCPGRNYEKLSVEQQ